MFDFDKVIKKMQKIISCPICKRKYDEKEIRIKGFFENTYFFEISCGKNHEPIKMMVIATKLNKTDKNIIPISKKEGYEFKKNLNNFRGNLQNILK